MLLSLTFMQLNTLFCISPSGLQSLLFGWQMSVSPPNLVDPNEPFESATDSKSLWSIKGLSSTWLEIAYHVLNTVDNANQKCFFPHRFHILSYIPKDCAHVAAVLSDAAEIFCSEWFSCTWVISLCFALHTSYWPAAGSSSDLQCHQPLERRMQSCSADLDR